MNIIYISIIFGISEFILMLVKRSKKGTTIVKGDRGSLVFLWISITAGFTIGYIMSEPHNFLLTVAGLTLVIFGVIVRWLAILQLGKSFTVDVAITDSAFLKTDGIYKKVRHPSYSGLMGIIAGFALTMGSFYSIMLFVVPVSIAIVYRIYVEEQILLNEFGKSYKDYINKTKRIIPGIY